MLRIRFLLFSLAALVLPILLWGAPQAEANLNVFYSQVGSVRLSVDASGSNTGSGTLQVKKPAGATVEKAFLFAASTGFLGYVPTTGDVALDGTDVSWNPSDTIANGIDSYNVAADVTAMIGTKIEEASSGIVDFSVTESNPGTMDGEILAVVFNDPTVATNSVFLMYGAQNTSGDEFSLGLAEPSKPSTALTMGLGISYGYQPAGQYSVVEVNGAPLTSSAGGQDDCIQKESATPEYQFCDNGALITAGGIGDTTENPENPSANDFECGGPSGEPAPRCDDELYNLKPFVSNGSTSIDVNTLNPSADDNILFASFNVGAAAVVGEGVVVGPTGTRSQVGTFHFLKALVQNESGQPEVGRNVKLEAISGPSAGMVLSGTTNAEGVATFNYTSSATGTDMLRATYENPAHEMRVSNIASHTWAPSVDGTFGGEWPYSGGGLGLNYSYGGAHRYLGNVVQGAANWNSSGAHVDITPWSGAPAPDQIPFVDIYLPDSWWGMTIFAENCFTCSFTRNSIALNQRTLDPESDAQRTKVATHELGHALGLEHPIGHVSPSVPSVMWQGLLGGSVRETPQPYDISRVNGMYP